MGNFKCDSKESCQFKNEKGICFAPNDVGCLLFHKKKMKKEMEKEMKKTKKIRKYTQKEAQAIIQQNIEKVNQEINAILKQNGLTLRVVHSVEIVPNVKYKNK